MGGEKGKGKKEKGGGRWGPAATGGADVLIGMKV